MCRAPRRLPTTTIRYTLLLLASLQTERNVGVLCFSMGECAVNARKIVYGTIIIYDVTSEYVHMYVPVFKTSFNVCARFDLPAILSRSCYRQIFIYRVDEQVLVSTIPLRLHTCFYFSCACQGAVQKELHKHHTRKKSYTNKGKGERRVRGGVCFQIINKRCRYCFTKVGAEREFEGGGVPGHGS